MIRVEAGKGVLEFDECIKEGKGGRVVKECLKGKERSTGRTKSTKEREDYLKKNGVSRLRWGWID